MDHLPQLKEKDLLHLLIAVIQDFAKPISRCVQVCLEKLSAEIALGNVLEGVREQLVLVQ
jgi:hypothetical protein